MMFKIILMSCIFAVSQAGRTPLEIRQFMLAQSMDCTKENSLSSAELQKLLDHELPNTKSSNCFIACVFKKIGWMDDKGVYNLEAAHKFADEEYVGDATKTENAKKLFDMCKFVNDEKPADGEEGCDRSNILARCFIDNAPKMGFHIALGAETK
uniref:Odorant binding protein n=1 Tax=Glyphodes pyloalis TaxID=1242752 RepID=A0A6M3GXQ3_GLYPY|nr:odorant binding protein [Glyphodes pyloalis]